MSKVGSKLEEKLPRGGQKRTHGGHSFLTHGQLPEHRVVLMRHLSAVRDLRGHHSVTVTQRYTHSNDERKREAVEALSKKAEVSDKMVTEENQSKLIH